MVRNAAFALVAAAVVLGSASCTASAPIDGTATPSGDPEVLTISNSFGDGSADPQALREVDQMLALYLSQHQNLAGDYPVRLVDSTPSQVPGADPCLTAAVRTAADQAVVAVIGPGSDACARKQVPAYNVSEPGPLLMVSTASDPGLTTEWLPGDPETFTPSGRRSFARVVATSEAEGAAMAKYAAENLELSTCVVLNDGEATSQRVVVRFVDAAAVNGVEVLGTYLWDPDAASYTDLFTTIAEREPECIVISGNGSQGGAQLLRDKVAVLGGNREVAVLASSDFMTAGVASSPESTGVDVPHVGWSVNRLAQGSPVARDLLTSYRELYGAVPTSAESLYAVAALQVALAGIEGSDGTREGVTDQILGGRGVVIPEEQSVLGRELRIDPGNGEVNLRDLTVFRMVDGAPALGTPVSVLPRP